MSHLHDCKTEDRQRAIESAARVMETTWPKLQHSATVEIGGCPLQVIYARLPSGALRVAQRDTGAVIAQSRPAALALLDPDCFPAVGGPAQEEAFDAVSACTTALDVLQVLAAQLRRPALRDLRMDELAYALDAWADRLDE